MKDLYISEVRKELTKYSNCSNDIITENDIVPLPEPIQKYFRYCGYLGKEKMNNAEIEWEDVFYKNSPNKKWMSLKCYQFNSVPEPTRIAYMKSRIMGIFPFEGRDKYQNGHGNMLIKFLKLLKVVDAKGKEMDESALVTVLAEALVVPTYAFQHYIKWTAIDSNTAKAVIRYNESEVSGLFYFDDLGEFIRFETDDRYYSERGTEYKKVKWSAVAGNYIEKNRIRFPSYLKAIWHTDEGDFEYFKGNIANIKFNIK
ncbi:hypothetical protein P378_20485 [Desulforamulus profundi]|uniref:Uncharacterized protein n=1 Tax=Desulforamulus profundi TaxID=1383067 RepID=A0A2C6MC12_9FIRM|nr:DUF6544 family protein [Desulforamulus profundi]PHJ36746.1 hypothetical protein P378_20485 [Desulforamulus profundi]